MRKKPNSLPMRCGIMTLTLAAATLTLSACSVFMAANQPPQKNLDVLRPGTPRVMVIAELGQPVSSETKDGKRVEVFSFTQGYSSGAKASRALFHGAADVVTAGLWEVVGTPTESVFHGSKMAFEVTYDQNNKVEKALPPGAGTQTSRLLISYSLSDGEFVDALEAKLTTNGIRVSRDPHDPQAPERIPDRAALASSTVLLVLSEHSVNDTWLKTEVESIQNLENEIARQVVYPLALDDAWSSSRSTRKLKTHDVLSFRGWGDAAAFQESFQRLTDKLSIVATS